MSQTTFGNREKEDCCYCCCSVAQTCQSLCDPRDCSTPGLPVLHHLPEFAQTHVHSVGDVIQPSHPLSSPLLPPSVFPSITVFNNESVLHIMQPKYWSFSFSFGPSNEHPGLISFRMDWLDLLAVQGTLKSLPRGRSQDGGGIGRGDHFLFYKFIERTTER